MGVRINVWYPKGDNIGHASVEIDGTYMSWWPDGGAGSSKLKMVKQVFAGGPGTAPTFADDKQMEGGEPSWTGDYFGWDRDGDAIDFWKKIYFSDLQKGMSAMRSGNANATYSFVANNCCDVVDKLLEKAGAYDWQIKLNLWRSIKAKLAPKDIATIGCYLGAQKDILDSPQMWSPVPEFWS
jgi:hypothetical protein